MRINARGPDGNAWVIMGRVKQLLKATDRMDEWPGIDDER